MQILAIGAEQIFPLVLFILLFVVLGWFQRNAPTEGGDKEEGSYPLPHHSPDLSSKEFQQGLSSEENMQMLRKALGLPAKEELRPPPVVRLPTPPQLHPVSLIPKSQPITPNLLDKAIAASHKTQISVKAKRDTPVIRPHCFWVQELAHDPAALRKGVILREVLGPPKGFNFE